MKKVNRRRNYSPPQHTGSHSHAVSHAGSHAHTGMHSQAGKWIKYIFEGGEEVLIQLRGKKGG